MGRHKDGNCYPQLLSLSVIKNTHGVVTNYVGVSTDISLLKEHEQRLEQLAHYDALTGLANRVLLAERLKLALSFSKRTQKIMAVCYLDLDGFKPINDNLGHQAGDHVLIEIAQRLNSSIRDCDTVCRLGGDEFVLVLPGLTAVEEAVVSVERVLKAIAKPLVIDNQISYVTASIGVSLFPRDSDHDKTLLMLADQAMYQAKHCGKNKYQFYQADNPVLG